MLKATVSFLLASARTDYMKKLLLEPHLTQMTSIILPITGVCPADSSL